MILRKHKQTLSPKPIESAPLLPDSAPHCLWSSTTPSTPVGNDFHTLMAIWFTCSNTCTGYPVCCCANQPWSSSISLSHANSAWSVKIGHPSKENLISLQIPEQKLRLYAAACSFKSSLCKRHSAGLFQLYLTLSHSAFYHFLLCKLRLLFKQVKGWTASR